MKEGYHDINGGLSSLRNLMVIFGIEMSLGLIHTLIGMIVN